MTKSLAQRALDATYPASRLCEAVSAAYWLASCHEEQAEYMASGRMQEAEERLAAIADAMGFKIERIVSEPAVSGNASVDDDMGATGLYGRVKVGAA